MRKIVRDYFRLARKEHLKFDLWIIFLIIAGISLSLYFNSPKTVLKEFFELNNTIVTALSILAGFNTTSLSILATSSSDVAKLLRKQIVQGNKSAMEQILAYFSWSVVFQLALLFYSILFSLGYTYFPTEISLSPTLIKFIAWALITLGITGTCYSLLLTIRNIIILYDFLIADSRASE